MSTIFDLVQLNTTEYSFVTDIEKDILYSALNDYVAIRMQAAQDAMRIFVEGDTTNARELYQLPMTGRDEAIASDANPPNKRRLSGWQVGFPIYTFRPSLAYTNVYLSYMTPGEFQANVDGIMNGYDETMRYEILLAIFNNLQKTFIDPEGTLANETVEPLANGDTVVYPPVLGAATEATENHYLVSGYTAANISDTNNPLKTIAADIIHHFGRRTGGSSIVVLINDAQRGQIEALSDFVPVRDDRIILNDTSAELAQYDNIPGEVIGRANGVTVSVWDYIPANYMFGRHMMATAPLKRRIDRAPGLGGGQLVSLADTTDRALQFNDWMYRFGFGAGNRLNGVVMQLKASGTYDIPTLA